MLPLYFLCINHTKINITVKPTRKIPKLNPIHSSPRKDAVADKQQEIPIPDMATPILLPYQSVTIL